MPALPWGNAGTRVPSCDDFGDSLRKLMLLAALGRKPGGDIEVDIAAAHSSERSANGVSDEAEPSEEATIDPIDIERITVDMKIGQRIEVMNSLPISPPLPPLPPPGILQPIITPTCTCTQLKVKQVKLKHAVRHDSRSLRK